MKRILFFSILAIAFLTIAPTIAAMPPNETSDLLLDDAPVPYFGLTTFAGIVALISLLVTQIAKKIPQINEKAIFKILVSLAIGTLVTYLAWWTEIAPFLENMVWWHVLIQGIFAGLSACGLYDLLKGIGLVSNK